jgi:hypothetical protein
VFTLARLRIASPIKKGKGKGTGQFLRRPVVAGLQAANVPIQCEVEVRLACFSTGLARDIQLVVRIGDFRASESSPIVFLCAPFSRF